MNRAKAFRLGFRAVSFQTGAVLIAFGVLMATSPSFSQMLKPEQLRGKKVLLVTGASDEENPSDDPLVQRHLESMGINVTTVKETDASSAADGTDLIMISSTANAHALQKKYTNVPKPVLTWNTYSYPEMYMTGPHLHTDYEVVDPTQFFARSYSILYAFGAGNKSEIGEAVDLKPQLFGTLYLQPGTAGWGRPVAGATIVANIEGDPGRAEIFAYEKGATMYNDFVAPARRVGFYMQSANFHLLTAVYGPPANDPDLRDWYLGLPLFDACVRWALSSRPQPAPYNPTRIHDGLAQTAKGKKLLFVIRKDAFEGKEADEHIAEHLKSLGFDLTIADQMDPQSVAQGQDAVILSATCSKYKLSNKYRDVPIPVLVLEGLFADTMRMAGRYRYIDYGEHGEPKESDDPPVDYLDIVGSWHPMAAGLKPGLLHFIKEPDVLKWAIPEPSAISIASVPGEQEQKAIFGYEKGAAMYGGYIAPARRAIFPLDNPAFDDLTEQGLALFDASIQWIVEGSSASNPAAK
jgi:hypothetical protein